MNNPFSPENLTPTWVKATEILKGDLPGHEFHGNQWTTVGVGGRRNENTLAGPRHALVLLLPSQSTFRQATTTRQHLTRTFSLGANSTKNLPSITPAVRAKCEQRPILLGSNTAILTMRKFPASSTTRQPKPTSMRQGLWKTQWLALRGLFHQPHKPPPMPAVPLWKAMSQQHPSWVATALGVRVLSTEPSTAISSTSISK